MRPGTSLALVAFLALALAAPLRAETVAGSAPSGDRMKAAGQLLVSGKYSDAVRAYQEIIGTDGKNAKAWIGLGLAYLHAGQRDLSQAAFDEAVRLEPARKEQLAKLVDRAPASP